MPVRRHILALLPVLTLGFCPGCGSKVEIPPLPPDGAITQPYSDVHSLRYPTAQTRLTDRNLAGVYQPTASGNPESGTYGTVRLGNYGKQILPRFHEGVDIAPQQRDEQGRPLDDVFAAAHGTVALVHRKAGNSDYGIYVVLQHADPVGVFYTLYAHMAEADPRLQEGQQIEAGTRLGRMGNTALEPIPMSRAHLHFEIGLMLNERFLSWPGLPKKHTPGGKFNGQNLTGLDPILVFRDFESSGGQLILLDHIRRVPIAAELVVRAPRLPDYFRRYPGLWMGPADFTGPMSIGFSEGGVPLSGRPANEEEIRLLGQRKATVLRVDEQIIGRNGRRLVVKRQGNWEIGGNGESWLSLLLH